LFWFVNFPQPFRSLFKTYSLTYLEIALQSHGWTSAERVSHLKEIILKSLNGIDETVCMTLYRNIDRGRVSFLQLIKNDRFRKTRAGAYITKKATKKC